MFASSLSFNIKMKFPKSVRMWPAAIPNQFITEVHMSAPAIDLWILPSWWMIYMMKNDIFHNCILCVKVEWASTISTKTYIYAKEALVVWEHMSRRMKTTGRMCSKTDDQRLIDYRTSRTIYLVSNNKRRESSNIAKVRVPFTHIEIIKKRKDKA